jgi:hypothetical protein
MVKLGPQGLKESFAMYGSTSFERQKRQKAAHLGPLPEGVANQGAIGPPDHDGAQYADLQWGCPQRTFAHDSKERSGGRTVTLGGTL